MERWTWLFACGWLSGLAAALLVALAIELWVRSWAWLWGRRDAVRARRPLGRPISAADAMHGGGVVTLRGRLQLTAGATARFEDGLPALAATLATSTRRLRFRPGKRAHSFETRAEGLMLLVDVDRGPALRLELAGPTRLLVGSRHCWLGRRLAKLPAAISERVRAHGALGAGFGLWARHYGVCRSLADGDEVLVHGRLQDRGGQAPSGVGYREAPCSHLVLGTDDEPLELAAVAAPRSSSHRRTWARGAWLVVSALLVALPLTVGGLRHHRQAQQCAAEDCPKWGYCAVELHRLMNLSFECVAGADADCRASVGCKQRGACWQTDGFCEVRSDDDCRQAEACAVWGRCRVWEGVCRATRADDCAASSACRDEGSCRLCGGWCGDSSCNRPSSADSGRYWWR